MYELLKNAPVSQERVTEQEEREAMEDYWTEIWIRQEKERIWARRTEQVNRVAV
jgi:hypothetical protein